MFLRRNEHPSLRRSVRQDWRTALPREKNYVFETAVRQWECSYAMMSVALDDAFSMRNRGELVCARQQVRVAADLLERLSGSLLGFCDAVSKRARRIEKLPVVEPMKTEFFRGDIAQSAASWNGILHRLLFGDRQRFVQKIRVLSETLANLDREFANTADDLFKGISVQPGNGWKMLDCLHYDYNTCLRETEVVLKSFLRALPPDQLPAFASELEAPVPSKRLRRMRPALSRASA